MQDTLGHYQVVEQIGSGGMGVVYRARDQRLERDVALKVLSTDRLADDESRRQFRREALALSKLNHPNIATIHDFDTIDGVDVLVMEHIPGRNLDALIEDGPLAEREVARLGQQLLVALEAAHQHGVIHRDLKPGNIRITPDGLLKVLDFGLARALQLDPEATTDSISGAAFAGTLPYMAPEQLRGERVDARTDVYAAGAVLYELATGTRVHPGLSGARLMGAILDEAPVSPRALNPRVSQDLEQVLCKALDKDPQLRYQSARELRVDLERLVAPAKSARNAATAAAAALRPLPLKRRVAVAGLIVAVLAATGWVAYREWPRNGPIQPSGWILIADFENGTGDSELGSVIRDGLTIQLQQSRFLNVLSREQVFDALRRMDRPGATTLDAATALELCRREAIPLLLTGTAYKRGDATWIAVQGMDAVSRAGLFTETEQFRSDGELFDRLDALAARVREHLGESLSGIQQRNEPLAKVTTSSLRALETYSLAADELARGNADRAVPLLEAALRVDPQFGMAHRLIARVYETLGNVAKEREHLARAYALRNNLTERERYHVEASYLLGQGKYEEAVNTLTVLTALYPGDGDGRYELAIAHRYAGNMNKAIEELEKTLVGSPFMTVSYGDLVLLLARTGNYTRAQQVLDEAQRRALKSARLRWGAAMVALGVGRIDAARVELRQLEADEEVLAGVARLYLATADMLEGKLDAAAQRLESAILLDQKARNALPERKRRTLLAAVAALQGHDAEARRQLAAAAGDSVEDLGADDSRRIGTFWARLGDLARARKMLDHLTRLRASVGSAFVESCYHNLAGELALANEQYDAALDAFRRATSQYPRPASSTGIARAYMAMRDWPRARDAWTDVLAWKGEILQEGFVTEWMLATLERARAARNAGDVAAARTDYTTFLTMWREGDEVAIRQVAAREADTLR